MSTATKLGAFAAAAVLVFAGAYGVGQLVGPVVDNAAAAPAQAEKEPPGGLMVSDHGLGLKILTDQIEAGVAQDFAFQILDRHGAPMTNFKVTHDKLMHLIVVRRDLSGFRHVHPTMSQDGTWRIPLTFAEAGEYRVLADFRPWWGIHNTILGADLSVAGDYRPRPLPPPSGSAKVGEYTVTLSGKPKPDESSRLTLSVSRNGQPVTDLQPYLAAYGHLIALRDGDLAYLHVHPEGHPGDGKTSPGPDIVFFTEVPSSGDYRLFLDFQHEGTVRTAEFTVHVEGPNPPPHGAPAEAVDGPGGGTGGGTSGGDGGGHNDGGH